MARRGIQQSGSNSLQNDPGWLLLQGGLGVFCSLIVVVLFSNIQEISDLAPAAIKQSDTPGILGAPIAILSAIWFLVIPLKFLRQVIRKATNPAAPFPSPFTVGAVVALCFGFALI